MERLLVHFSANEQKLVCSDPFRVSSYKVQYVEAHFDLGQNWTGFDSVRAVWWNDFATIGTVLDSLGVCRVPAEVLRRKGPVMVNLVGSISDGEVLTDRLTTYPVEGGAVDANSRIDGADPHPATPSQVEQFADRVRTDANRAETAASGAEASASAASASATSAANSATAAHNDKIAIEQAIADVIRQIEDFEQVEVVVNTLPAGSSATSDFTNGVLTLGIPRGDKGDTGNGIQSITKTGSSGLVDTYTITYTEGQTTTFTVTNGEKGDTGNGIASIEKTGTDGLVDTYTINYTDGNATTFTVTNGEQGPKGDPGEVSLDQLLENTVVQVNSDNEPYNFRPIPKCGHFEFDKIIGASVAWNQLVAKPSDTASRTSNGITWQWNDGVCDVSGAFTGSSYQEVWSKSNAVTVQTNHVYLFTFYNNAISNVLKVVFGGGRVPYAEPSCLQQYTIKKATANGAVNVYYRATGTSDFSMKIQCLQSFDLTHMFGSVIADYVQSLEQASEGSGLAWLRKYGFFDKEYFPFDSGSIQSVSGLEGHKMTGKNLLDINASGVVEGKTILNDGTLADAQWVNVSDYIRVPSGKAVTYTSVGDPAVNSGFNRRIICYDSNKQFLGSCVTTTGDPRGLVTITGTTLDGTAFVRVAFGKYSTSGNQLEIGSTATPYEPYEKHTYPLDSSVILRGRYYLDSNNQLRAMGDVYPSSGEIGRNWSEEVDLGSLTWTYNSTRGWFRANLPTSPYDYGVCVCSHYPFCDIGRVADYDKVVTIGGTGLDVNRVIIKDTAFGSDINAFKASLQSRNVTLIYLLATPTTETAQPYTNPQNCENGGTEEYVGSELPVGHETEYPMTFGDTIPTENGTYTMSVTVQNGQRTINWA